MIMECNGIILARMHSTVNLVTPHNCCLKSSLCYGGRIDENFEDTAKKNQKLTLL
jgi:hypothetical protein